MAWINGLIRLHLLHYRDKIDVLKEFMEQDDIDTRNVRLDSIKEGLVALDNSDIIKISSSEVKIGKAVTKLVIYPYGKDTYSILNKIYPYKSIIKVEFMCTRDVILDITSYASVKTAYDALIKSGHKASSDKELIELAVSEMVPSKKLVIAETSLGGRAFPGSKVAMYRMKVVHCYDLNLIVGASLIR